MIKLTQAYSGLARHYHDISHINYMIKRALHWGWELTPSLICAIWYHDVVCEPGAPSGENERKSADMFIQDYEVLKVGLVQPLDTREVEYAILSTQLHIPLNLLANRLIDLDLAILAEEFNTANPDLPGALTAVASPPYPYDSYLINVRKEYGAYSDRAWFSGRTDWLNGFMGRSDIFCTPEGKRDCQDRARANLETERRLYGGLI